MKKCPYCSTLMNDDVNQCPNCLKDMSNLRSMPDISLVNKKPSVNLPIYGCVLSVGGVLASLSQGIAKKNYQAKYDEIYELIKQQSSNVDEKLVKEATEYLNLINDCSFREVFFYIVAGLGLILIIVGIIMLLKKKSKKKEN